MNARSWLVASLFVSAGCGLIQVNGKPLGGSKSSSSSGSSQTAQAEEPAAQKETSQAAEEGSGKRLDEITPPGGVMAQWTPVQQYIVMDRSQDYPAIIIADQLGSKLSQAGRLAMIEKCMHRTQDATAAALWAACGPDVDAFKLDAFTAELKKEGLGPDARGRLVDHANEVIAFAKDIGAAVTKAAADEPGIAEVVAMGAKARAEWKAFAAANADQLAELARLEVLVDQEKNGLAGDCMAKTQPPIAKLVRATKWRENDTAIDPNYFYVNELPATTEAFVAMLAYSDCLYLTHKSGAPIWGAARATHFNDSDTHRRRYWRIGPRTLTIAKIFQEPFKPKFSSRTMAMSLLMEPKEAYYSSGGGKTPAEAVVAKLIKNGELTTIKFAKDKILACVSWRDTNKVMSISTGGSVMYERECMKREPLDNEYEDVETATVFTDGLAPGVDLLSEAGFPILAKRGDKYVAALGVKL